MLTTAACPAASRNRRPLSSVIQQPSPRTAMGKVFLKLREKSPLFISMACPGKNCSRVATARSKMLGMFLAKIARRSQPNCNDRGIPQERVPRGSLHVLYKTSLYVEQHNQVHFSGDPGLPCEWRIFRELIL